MSKGHKKRRPLVVLDEAQMMHEHLLALTKPQLRSGYASALAEADLARGNTTAQHGRVLELEAELNTLRQGIERDRIATVSTLVTLIRQCQATEEVVKILGPTAGWHEAGADECRFGDAL